VAERGPARAQESDFEGGRLRETIGSIEMDLTIAPLGAWMGRARASGLSCAHEDGS
jgi:hypothetical protein